MGTKDKRIDAYIAKSADFARPVMKHLRELIHKACPDVTETIKWGMPSFEYKGPFVGFAAFKNHAAFGFWKAAIMKDKEVLLSNQATSMGNLGRITSMKDLPKDKIIMGWLKEAMKLNDEGVKVPRTERAKSKTKKEVVVPDYMMKEIKRDKKAKETFESFSPSHKREYVEWITEAKTEETREKRIATMMEWLGEGKSRHWKYVPKK